MKRFSLYLILLLLLFTFVFCGKKGPILPPIKKIPQNVEVFEIAQRGEKLILDWENPSAYADGSSLSEIAEVEIWLAELEKGTKQISTEEFEKIASLAVSIKKEKFSDYQGKGGAAPGKFRYLYGLTGKDYAQRSLAFGLTVKDRKKRKSAFSEVLAIEPRIISLPPAGIKATVFEDRIEITWGAPEKNIDRSSPPKFKGYNIYKMGNDGSAYLLNSKLIKETRYSDKDILFGEVHGYFLRAAASDSLPLAESENSEVIEIMARDNFAPAVPSGLVSIAAEDFISISWDTNLEEDLAG